MSVWAAFREAVYRAAKAGGATYAADGMILFGKDASFLRNSDFMRAYRAGINSGHRIARKGGDIHIEWRVRVALWAASQASLRPGDFVECGVNTGILSLAIFNTVDMSGRRFWLFDTYEGIPVQQMTKSERAMGETYNAQSYEQCFDLVKRNFAPYPEARLVRGVVPDTLSEASVSQVAYLSLDMNITAPEIAALEYFWPKVASGGVVLLDDYAFTKHHEQKAAFDDFSAREGVPVLPLPTGQGLIVKP